MNTQPSFSVRFERAATSGWRQKIPTFVGLAIPTLVVVSILVGHHHRPAGMPDFGRQAHITRAGAYKIHESSPNLLAVRLVVNMVLNWVLVIVMATIVLFWERKPLSSVGVRKPSLRDVDLAMVSSFLIFPLAFISEITPLQSNTPPALLASIFAMPFKIRLFMLLANPLAEEFLFRGFVIERLEALTGSIWIAAGASCVADCLAHVGWSWGYAVDVAPQMVALAAFYVWRRNLFASGLLHFMWDSTLILYPWMTTGHLTGLGK